MNDYHINIFYSEEDGGCTADIPDLWPCSAFGETPEQALKEILIAKEGWLEVAREKGLPIPEPMYRPVIYQVYAAQGTSTHTK
jgi:predicted RNase H-like HicB family nuclease